MVGYQNCVSQGWCVCVCGFDWPIGDGTKVEN